MNSASAKGRTTCSSHPLASSASAHRMSAPLAQRAVGHADWSSLELGGDLSGDIRHLLRRQARLVLAGINSMAAEMRHFRAGQQIEQAVVCCGQATDHAKLSARAGVGAMIGAVARQRQNERFAGAVLVSEQQVRLGLSGRRVVRAVVPLLEHRENLGREQSGPLDVTGEERKRGGVYRRVVAACPLIDRGIALCGTFGMTPLSLPDAGKRDVLLDSRAQGGDLLVVDRLEPQLRKSSGRLVRRTRTGQGKHRPVLQPKIVRIQLESAYRQGRTPPGTRRGAPRGGQPPATRSPWTDRRC